MNMEKADAANRLRDRMAKARAECAARHRVTSYVLPIGFMAIALLFAVHMRSDFRPQVSLSPLVAASVYARSIGGIIGARVAVAIAAPITVYIGWVEWQDWYATFAVGHLVALIGLCISPSVFLPKLRSPTDRLAREHLPSQSEHRMQIP